MVQLEEEEMVDSVVSAAEEAGMEVWAAGVMDY